MRSWSQYVSFPRQLYITFIPTVGIGCVPGLEDILKGRREANTRVCRAVNMHHLKRKCRSNDAPLMY